MATNYEALELTIRGSFDDPQGFEVEANYGPSVGSGLQKLAFPYTRGELETRVELLKREAMGLRREGDAGRSGVNVESFGSQLFEAVFKGPVRDVLREAQSRGPVRIRLRVNAADLADVPWEYLYDRSKGRYLALRSDSPVVRTFVTGTSVAEKLTSRELNVLVMVAGGGGAELSVEEEFAQLEQELGSAANVSLTRLATPTIAALQAALREPGAEYHVFHFIGHGSFDDQAEAAALYLEDDAGQPIPVPAEQLTRILSDHDSLRLVMLNSCEGARTSVSDPQSGLAQKLFVGGVQVVIAMQYELTDPAALTFSRLLYSGLAEHQPVEQAVTEARKLLDGREWATPVVFMRSDGRFFADTTSVTESEPELEPTPAPDPQPTPEPEPATRPEPAPEPVQAAVAPDLPATPDRPGGRTPMLIGVVALVVVLAVVGFVLSRGGGDDSASSDSADADVATTTEAPATTESASSSEPDEAAGDDEPVSAVDDLDVDESTLAADATPGFVEPEDPPFENASKWFDLLEGECVVENLLDETGYEGFLWQQVVSCDRDLVLRVFDVVDIGADTSLAGTDLSAFPGADVLADVVVAACDETLAGDAELQDLGYLPSEVLRVDPTEELWADGIRTSVCVVPWN